MLKHFDKTGTIIFEISRLKNARNRLRFSNNNRQARRILRRSAKPEELTNHKMASYAIRHSRIAGSWSDIKSTIVL
jgi:hypothetical protein